MGDQPWCDLVRVTHLPTSQSQPALLAPYSKAIFQVAQRRSLT